ncbi:AraC family transcriptional regulator [Desulfotomaculum sp. 1211_IL3151]|uniref:AraC family transcriptional regulator n=1 Tax=Desulfotomaculum sp. 1211_IL3151 TaxID=3084055 RepID=UPI002FD9DA35
MDKELRKLQGDALSPSLFVGGNNSYSCPQMTIVSSNVPIDMESGVHEHESYEFVLPITIMPHVRFGKKVMYYEPNKVYPINVGQSHGAYKVMPGIKLKCIMVDKTFMDNLTYSIIGKTGLAMSDSPFNQDAELKFLIDTFIKESKMMQVGYDFILQSLSTQILVKLIRHFKGMLPAKIEKKQTILTSNHINKVIEMIREYYNRNFSLGDLAREANLSPYHFIRAFKNQTGKTPYDYLINIRIEKAKELMHLNLNITDICLLCGFNNHSHFTTVFKKKVGVTPTEYRQILYSK